MKVIALYMGKGSTLSSVRCYCRCLGSDMEDQLTVLPVVVATECRQRHGGFCVELVVATLAPVRRLQQELIEVQPGDGGENMQRLKTVIYLKYFLRENKWKRKHKIGIRIDPKASHVG